MSDKPSYVNWMGNGVIQPHYHLRSKTRPRPIHTRSRGS
jgi:hypothetical protein